MSDYDLSIHTNPDARAWAKFFMECNPDANVTEDTMIGWFANAMMAMHDHMRPDLAPVVMPDGSAFVGGSVNPGMVAKLDAELIAELAPPRHTR